MPHLLCKGDLGAPRVAPRYTSMDSLTRGRKGIGDFRSTQQCVTERRINANVKKSTVSMALANHEAPFDVGVDASLHKVPIETAKRSNGRQIHSVMQGLAEAERTTHPS